MDPGYNKLEVLVMKEQVVLLAIFIAFFLVNVISVNKLNKLGEQLSKPFLMPTLLLIYLYSTSTTNLFVVFALVCGFLGDVFLLERERFFVFGVVAFLIGHILYILALTKSISFFQIPIPIFIFILPYIFFGIVVYKKLGSSLNSIRGYALIYIIIILAMSFSSLLRIRSITSYQFWMPFIGSILFIISDSILAMNEFKKNKKNKGAYVMLTYVTAQLLIVAGFI